MSANPNSPSNLTIDGTNYLTCPGSSGAAATLKPLFHSFDPNANSQIWEVIIPDSALPEQKQLKCTLSDGQVFYLTGSGSEGATLTVSNSLPTNLHWTISGGVISLVLQGGSTPQYANHSNLTPIENESSVVWSFVEPISPIAVDTLYELISNDNLYLTAETQDGKHAKLTTAIETLSSEWKITGNLDSATGKITEAQIFSNNGWYIYGLHSDNSIKCYNSINSDYNWTIQDNGDGSASFNCNHLLDNADIGYLDNDGNRPVTQITGGRPGQKWKYKKALSSTGMGLPS